MVGGGGIGRRRRMVAAAFGAHRCINRNREEGILEGNQRDNARRGWGPFIGLRWEVRRPEAVNG
jgi:hypothetical protein